MKITKASNKILKQMVNNWADSGREGFSYKECLTLLPETEGHVVEKAIGLLHDDGFIDVQYADNIPYQFSLKVSGIREIEENTMLKKGYESAKEILSLIR